VAGMAVAREKSGGSGRRGDFEGTSNLRISGVFPYPSLTSIFTSFLDHLRQVSPTFMFDRTLYREF